MVMGEGDGDGDQCHTSDASAARTAYICPSFKFFGLISGNLPSCAGSLSPHKTCLSIDDSISISIPIAIILSTACNCRLYVTSLPTRTTAILSELARMARPSPSPLPSPLTTTFTSFALMAHSTAALLSFETIFPPTRSCTRSPTRSLVAVIVPPVWK